MLALENDNVTIIYDRDKYPRIVKQVFDELDVPKEDRPELSKAVQEYVDTYQDFSKRRIPGKTLEEVARLMATPITVPVKWDWLPDPKKRAGQWSILNFPLAYICDIRDFQRSKGWPCSVQNAITVARIKIAQEWGTK